MGCAFGYELAVDGPTGAATLPIPLRLKYSPRLGHGRIGERLVIREASTFDQADTPDLCPIRPTHIDRSATADLVFPGLRPRLHLSARRRQPLGRHATRRGVLRPGTRPGRRTLHPASMHPALIPHRHRRTASPPWTSVDDSLHVALSRGSGGSMRGIGPQGRSPMAITNWEDSL